MQFDAADITDILDLTGEDITVKLLTVTVKTIRGKFRKDFETVSPFEATAGTLNPSFMCAISDMSGVTSSNTFVIDGVEYRMHTKPQDLASGFTRVILAKK
jgi:hypothetical protein